MTSTSFNVGVDIEAKSSSRVLRPPGGGHTDIFGVPEPILPQGRKEDRRNASSILEGTNQEIPTQNIQKKQNGDSINGTVLELTHDKPQKPKDSPIEQKSIPQVPDQSAPKRGRVPPGGFSSGLW